MSIIEKSKLMGIISIITKTLEVIKEDITTPKSFKDGQKFEDYITKYLFKKESYDCLEMTHNYQTNSKFFVKASLKPDFKFRDKKTNKEFYVEAKFRSTDYKGKVIWCNEQQLKRYQEIHKITPVFLLLGEQGNPNKPNVLSLILLDKAKYTGLFPSYIDKFNIEFEQPVTSKILWNR